jgi:hypothetical protein
MLVEMVQGNYEGYMKNDILKVKQARRAQAMTGNPSKKDYKGWGVITLFPIVL